MENLGAIGFTEEQADLLSAAQRFCREKSSMEKARKLIESDSGFDESLWAEIAALGWLGVAIPEEFGGVGLTLGELAPIVEQMGRSMLVSPFVATTLAAQVVLAGGAEQQKSKLLSKIAGGETATLALLEKSGDWRLDQISASARRDSDGLVLAGEKIFVQFARNARWIIVSFMLDGAPVLAVLSKALLTQENCRREKIIDVTKCSYTLRLDGLRIPVSALLDQEKTRAAFSQFELAANLLASAEMTGATAACIDYTIDYLQTRKQFGRTIGSYQALKHTTVDIYTTYEQARSHLYAAANSINDQGTGEIAVRMAKAQSLKALSFAADRAIQFHGGFGFTWECDAHLYRRAAAFHAAQYGDEAWQRKRLAELLF